MQTKKLFLAGLLLLWQLYAFSQNDKVFLKNGSLLYGQVVSATPDTTLFRTDNSLFRINNLEVNHIKLNRRNRAAVVPHVLDVINKNDYERGLKIGFEGGVLVGGDGVNQSHPQVTFSVLTYYKLEPWAQLGVNIGFENYFRFRCVPFLVYYKTDLDRKDGGAFVYAAFGYGKPWQRRESERDYEKLSGGVALKLGAGHTFNIGIWPMELSLAYSLQKVREVYPERSTWGIWGGEVQTILSRSMNRMLFKLGIYI
ncbi:hypothetical protein C900_02468 [Fulvivirga imtechensis AK7]|uniref:Outer membrane protein beta-barrel domain-containing protein n=1 Tax=Fulvivirga imtechensis AK7 TaxID=1237149 RepID=L8JTI5_9BACT|nr:hypothetical protein [Fulvivirga imtechensis]ELR71553.1 hypothetical protein C900_02468 [Fulvivirga imtechensis AK7]